jgi:antitoxin VapB
VVNVTTAKLFANGQSQAVRLPKEFRFEGNEVYIKKIGNAVILFPKGKAWDMFKDGLAGFSDDFMEGGRDQDDTQERDVL